MNKKTLSILLIIGVFLISAGISYTLFSKKNIYRKINFSSSNNPAPHVVPEKNDGEALSFNENQPKTEQCPLNGAMYSKEQRDWWEKHRPLGVMIENHEDARPQSGLSYADVVYEAVAEGGITRFLAVFYCRDGGIVGPVRSARTYFIDWISEYGNYPLYTHVGGANCNESTGSGCANGGKADALGQISDYKWTLYNDLSGFSLGFPDFIKYPTRTGREVATEHTVYSRTTNLWKIGEKRGLTNEDKDGESWDKKFVSYSFKDDASLSERPASQTIHLEHWKGYSAYFVDWEYDRENNVYKRSNGGKPHIDRNNNKQLTAKNIVVLFMEESNANDGYDNNVHLLYKNKGTGKGVALIDGKKTDIKWRKDGRTGRTLLFDLAGSAIKFDKGNIWFEILPTEGVINIK